MGELLESIFINPSLLPGGREWHESCALYDTLLGSASGKSTAHILELQKNLQCSTSVYYGFFQATFLLLAYGAILAYASINIANGSELLLLVPELRGIVGSVVLPILGAVPDGCLAFGPNAQEELGVGVGALAGSTIMILTVPWMLSILLGRVDIRPDGTPNYKRPRNIPRNAWRKLSPQTFLQSLTRTGVATNPAVSIASRILLFTSLSYIVIQGAAFFSGSVFKATQDKQMTQQIAEKERFFALFCAVFAFALFIWYLWYQVKASRKESDYRDSVVEEVTQRAIRGGRVSLSGVFFAELSQVATKVDETTNLMHRQHANQRFRGLLKHFFSTYDDNGDNHIDTTELQYVMYDLGERLNPQEIQSLHDSMDSNRDGLIDFNEFCAAIPKFIKKRGDKIKETEPSISYYQNGSSQIMDSEAAVEGGSEGEEEEEEEEVPKDLIDEDPKVQIRNLLMRAFQMMAVGTVLILIFSDPTVTILSDIGRRINVPGFYISFIVTPLISNSSEILASARYARKKTHETVTISFATLLGAACCNNTFVLFIFMTLVFTQGLAWTFTAETSVILLVEYVIVYLSQKKVQTMKDGYIALLLFPLSLALVAFLEGVVGLD